MARLAGVAHTVIGRAESSDGVPNIRTGNLVAIEGVIGNAGITLSTDGNSISLG